MDDGVTYTYLRACGDWVYLFNRCWPSTLCVF